jgi:hypothetical protein
METTMTANAKPDAKPASAPVTTVHGKPVTDVRNQKQGDPGFDANKDQVVVTNADGTESTVLRSDVKTK